MPYITAAERQPFIRTKIVKHSDFTALADISRELKLKKDETGFSANQLKNFFNGDTCSEKTKEAIMKYFNEKLFKLKKEFDRII